MESLYDRIVRRDVLLDGVIFVGVRTTGLYCRPVCRARIPREVNVQFFRSAAAAEARGLRPCLRCRPESAPFCPAWNGTRTTVERALVLINKGALDKSSVEALAARLGVGSRHLSRLFAHHLQASPPQIAQTRRVQRAKRLLDEKNFPLAAIAIQSGFASARRMGAAFTAVYSRPPSAFRKRKSNIPGDQHA